MTHRREFLRQVGVAGGALAYCSASGEQAVADTDRANGPIVPTERKASTFRVALMQAFPAGSNQQQNQKKAEDYCLEAAKHGADLLLMPEMWNIGYQGFNRFDAATTSRWQEQAVPEDGAWVGHFRELAKELGLAVAATYLQRWEGAPRNSVSLIDRHGQLVLTYGKVHTCDFAFEAALTPGEAWSAVDLDTVHGPVRVGAMICFDREFPESARCLMLQGAEVVITPNACLLDPLRIAQFQVRAYENSMAMLMANYPAPLNNGQSVAFDAAGTRLTQANDREGLYFADVDLNGLRFYRERSLWGNAWRRPHRYTSLSEAAELPIFQRDNAYGDSFDSSDR